MFTTRIFVMFVPAGFAKIYGNGVEVFRLSKLGNENLIRGVMTDASPNKETRAKR
jgi:hypothetical protein